MQSDSSTSDIDSKKSSSDKTYTYIFIGIIILAILGAIYYTYILNPGKKKQKKLYWY